MTSHSTTPLLPQSEIETEEYLFDNWFDPIETGLRDRTRDFLQAMFEAELDELLARSRYCRRAKPPSDSEAAAAVSGHRHGHRSRSLLGTFGKVEIAGFVTNLLNEDYMESYIEKTTLILAGLPPTDVGIAGDKRRYGIRTRVRF